MIREHLSETEIQQCALDKSGCADDITRHADSCKSCQSNVQAYLQLFSTIHDQPAPAFDFNLPELVLQQLPKAKSKFSLNIFFVYFIGLVAACGISIPVYLFRKYILNLFTGILPMTMYLILITAITIIIFQSIEMFRKYQKQISALN
jgi:hypothetical protein